MSDAPDQPTSWHDLSDGAWRAAYLQDALEPEVRELAEFATTLPLGALDLVRLRDRLDELVKQVKEAKGPGRQKGRGLLKIRERRLAELEANERRWLTPSDFRALADEEIATGRGGTQDSKAKQISEIYHAMRPGLPKYSAKPPISSE